MFPGKPHGPPKDGEGELGKGIRIILGVLRDVRLADLSICVYGSVHRIALGVGPAEDGVLIGLPRQLVQLLQFLPRVAIIA